MTTADIQLSQNKSELAHQQDCLDFEHLIHILPSGLIVINASGRIAFANNAAKSFLGWPLVEHFWTDIIERAFQPKPDDGHDISLKDGRKIQIETQPLGNHMGQLIVMQDVTQSRGLQEQLAHLQALAAMGKTAASLAHQIRTPLSSAMLYLCQMDSKSKSQAETAGLVNKIKLRLQAIEHQVTDMLAYLQQREPVKEEISVPNFIQQCTHLLQELEQNNNLTFITEGLEVQYYLSVNKSSLFGAIENLVNNANQSSESTVNIKVAFHCTQEQLTILVEDDGPGIPSEQLDKVFEPFYTTKTEGTGLGLSVVASVVDKHGGSVNIRSSEQGTGISILLPVVEGHNE